jgi:hypothetical protein
MAEQRTLSSVNPLANLFTHHRRGLSAREGICSPALLDIIIVLEVLFATTEPPLFPHDNPLKNYSLEPREKINILLHKAFETPGDQKLSADSMVPKQFFMNIP